MGGNPGADPFTSPGDPAFWLHHAQVDRMYWIWQMMDLKNRQVGFHRRSNKSEPGADECITQGVAFTNTMLDFPPSAKTTVEDIINMGPLGSELKIKDVMNTVGGSPLCYVYI